MSKNHKKLERLLLFYEVAQYLSFSKAAEHLDISRSYLSQQIRSLEQDLHTQLLIRTTRSVRLTTEGHKVFLQAQAMHHNLLDLERELEHSGEDVAGILRITAPAAFAESFLVEVCNGFNQRYPEVSFEIDVGHHLEDLHERNFDLAIRVTEQPPQNMVARTLMPYCHWVCASPAYLAEQFVPTQPSDLSQLQCLAFPTWRTWTFKQANKVQEFEAQGRFAVNDNNILIKAALNAQGVIRVPEHLVWEHVQAGRLQRLLADFQVEPRQVWMLYPPKIEHSSRLQQFMAYLQDHISSLLTKSR
ncbi:MULTISPECIES: LysR family transcriptional regulator [unclassified Agarivorans]|uniref:LysR family transcriptional regulator n=1 Tax=unclassified Agarivorans TaxID=2636026 RepID=UPI0026E4202C|nr:MULTISPECIES: LysR family transcriptional regulator [unclassified Agarivorans]MDO6684071.1 LysR substrate-binding domain-containing protein [Agarivorans sp. 3_MG-2023]MDO6714195.1 LysR substrate-binding domain-containing protein [Agarivorans sp. 2_MG-2023]